MNLSYRIAAGEDIETLVGLRAAFLGEFLGSDPSDLKVLAALRDFFVAMVPNRDFLALFAESEGRVVGVGCLLYHQHPPSPKNLTGRQGYIMNMYTLPEYRGRAIGSAIVGKLVDYARASGCCVIRLHAADKARPIYEKAGFVATNSEMKLEFSNQ